MERQTRERQQKYIRWRKTIQTKGRQNKNIKRQKEDIRRQVCWMDIKRQ